jgi:AraC-like DNA-binding protein
MTASVASMPGLPVGTPLRTLPGMGAGPHHLNVNRHRSELGDWETASRSPDPRLRRLVLRYDAFVERPAGALARREVPFAGVPLVISFGAPYRIGIPGSAGAGSTRSMGCFVAGLHDVPVTVGSTGHSWGVQVNLTPLGAYRVLGLPMHTLTNRTLEMEAVLGRWGERLIEAVFEAPDPGSRFDLLDAVLLARLQDGPAPTPSIERAWHRLASAHGSLSIGELATDLGCSRKHLIERFREQLGLPPKKLARILRFQRVVRGIERAGEIRFDDLALACGYYDQAHLIRDFQGFAGTTPTGYARLRLPGGAGVAA